MGTWNIIVLVLNVVLFILVVGKMTQFYNLYQDNLRVQNNIESLVEQNSQLVNLILDELEGKISEARTVMAGLDNKFSTFPKQEQQKTMLTANPESGARSPESGMRISETGREREDIAEEVFLDFSNAARSKIIYMRQMGMSVQEIAEKLQLSQGEIDLKLNLQEKHSTTTRKLRKLK